jgi:LmbE family N-acetylglucosaminyl deacetylase
MPDHSVLRRSLLDYAARFGLAAAIGLQASPAGAEEMRPARLAAPGRKLKVIVAGGHPGDPEYGCGGMIARYTDLGHEVVLLYLNRGDSGYLEKPVPDTKPVRMAEAAKACEILKARPLYDSQLNGKAVVDNAHYEEFRKLLEAEKPDVLFTHWPIDNHRDHRAASVLVYDAWLKMRPRPALYYYEVSNGEDTVMFAPTDYVDITPVEERKKLACFAHASQTPDRYYALQSQVTRFRGIESGHEQAEGYVRHPQSPRNLLPMEA